MEWPTAPMPLMPARSRVLFVLEMLEDDELQEIDLVARRCSEARLFTPIYLSQMTV
jgi:hypothetical protein